MSDEGEVTLSVIVTMVGGGLFTRRCLDRLVPQIQARPIEVIVPHDSTAEEITMLKERFPQILFVDMGVVETIAPSGSKTAAHEIYDRRRAAGLHVARGGILALLEDYGVPAQNWCDQVLEAHDLPYGVIGGAVEHEGQAALNWSVYFLDFGRYQLPLPEGRVDYLTDNNVSYKRSILDGIRDLWKDRYNEETVHRALIRQGVALWQRPQIVVYQNRGQLSFLDLAKERYAWGRLFGCIRAQGFSRASRIAYVLLGPAIPIVLLGRMARKVVGGRRCCGQFLLALPQTIFMATMWCFGECMGYLTGRESSL